MSAKTFEERIKDLQKRQEQLKAQEKALKARHSAEERKARTKRLIELGGAVESVLKKALGDEAGIIRKEGIPLVIDYLQKQEDRGKFFSKAIERGRINREEKFPSAIPEKAQTEETEDFFGKLF